MKKILTQYAVCALAVALMLPLEGGGIAQCPACLLRPAIDGSDPTEAHAAAAPPPSRLQPEVFSNLCPTAVVHI